MIALIVAALGIYLSVSYMSAGLTAESETNRVIQAESVVNGLFNHHKAYQCHLSANPGLTGNIPWSSVSTACHVLGMVPMPSYHATVWNGQLYVYTNGPVNISTASSTVHQQLRQSYVFGIKDHRMVGPSLQHILISPLSNLQVGALAPSSIPNGSLVLIGK